MFLERAPIRWDVWSRPKEGEHNPHNTGQSEAAQGSMNRKQMKQQLQSHMQQGLGQRIENYTLA